MTDTGFLIAQLDSLKWLEDPSKLTLFALTFMILVAGKMKVWVFGWVYDARVAECEKAVADIIKIANERVADAHAQRDKWQDVTLRAIVAANKLIENGSPS